MTDFKRLSGLFFVLFFSSCGRQAVVTTDGGSSGSPSVNQSGTISVKVSTAWEDANEKFEEIKPSNVTCVSTGTATSYDKNPVALRCEFEIPEEQLYYSRLRFEVEKPVLDEGCAVIRFIPYSYQISSVKDANADCTGTLPSDLKCYSGPGVGVAGFPENNYLTDTSKGKIDFKFTNVTRTYKTGNKYASNDILDSLVDIGAPGYVQSSLIDYQAFCEDIFGNTLAKIEVKINDKNGVNPDNDDFCDWRSLDLNNCEN